MEVEIRPATAADVEAFHGGRFGKTLRAVAVYADGELAAIAGVTVGPEGLAAFSEIRDGVKAPKLTVWRTAREVMKILTRTKAPIWAVASGNWPNAGRFLERLGFHHVGSSEEGEVYQWQSLPQ